MWQCMVSTMWRVLINRTQTKAASMYTAEDTVRDTCRLMAKDALLEWYNVKKNSAAVAFCTMCFISIYYLNRSFEIFICFIYKVPDKRQNL